ncbi:DUF3332 family protein [Candidatus Sumerlaeota bacterium]|nr:DUF3332 family protein [Candidatus Sumerlaeota bacterium]
MRIQKKTYEGVLPRMRKQGRKGALVCLLAMTAMSLGCYGRFPMTHALYNMNGNVENKVIRNVVFWLLAWFPIYWFAQVGDAIIFNLIEFWTGSEVDLGAVSTNGDRAVTLKSSEDRNTLFMTISKKGEPDINSRFVRIEDGKYELRDGDNHLAGKIIRSPEGNLNLTDAQGNTLRTITAAELPAKSGF